MQDLVDIAANEFENKAEIPTSESKADAVVTKSAFMTDEEIDRRLETVLILQSQLSLEATASTNTAESILKHSSDVGRHANQAYIHTDIQTYRQS